ncbi:MAG: type III pantothenate kinase [Elusimicrobia bacterium]|nr:type III pantothenate kinase [Elusimicrobiota bacterium]
MLLAIDIGNTNITLGLFDRDKLKSSWRLATNHASTADEYGLKILGLLRHENIDPAAVAGAVLASVVPPLTGFWMELCRRYLGVEALVVDAGVKTGMSIRYDDPKSVGADRVVDAVAAFRLYGGPACIVDFGTATTFDAISENGDYLGGAIAPGIGVATESLYKRTAKLPRIEIARPPSVIGKNTVHSMQAGVLFGYVGLIEGIVSRFRKELGPSMKVVGTGGLLDLIAAETPVIEIKAPWLTLDGLRLIYEMNMPQAKYPPKQKKAVNLTGAR